MTLTNVASCFGPASIFTQTISTCSFPSGSQAHRWISTTPETSAPSSGLTISIWGAWFSGSLHTWTLMESSAQAWPSVAAAPILCQPLSTFVVSHS